MSDNNNNLYNDHSEQINNNLSLNGHGSFISSFLASSPFSSLKHHPVNSSSCIDLASMNKDRSNQRLATMTLSSSESGSSDDVSNEDSIKNEKLIDKDVYELNNKSNRFDSSTEKYYQPLNDTKQYNSQLSRLKQENSSNMYRTKSLQDLPSLSSATGNYSIHRIQ
ncbi:hypothetical protein LY90DRAFT_500371 [Neocallimastix californiae]|uniref:Uncharacterized protein n=1 Tax=Neocallimastix californiae TaxID=1754190 RepID=A0A1Y2F9L5_9FUNG|nr:hypothetical protein LY90DRAFT_500371 [Neocallimastix californiae]|eukprot:ORY80591.1 hypothetical protein LY90DRAFT_500371 [Neocallimastix californiae]